MCYLLVNTEVVCHDLALRCHCDLIDQLSHGGSVGMAIWSDPVCLDGNLHKFSRAFTTTAWFAMQHNKECMSVTQDDIATHTSRCHD